MPFRHENLVGLQRDLLSLRAEMLGAEQRFFAEEPRVHASFRLSAANLIHYLVLRRDDRRLLQERLSERGLSSLGRCEAHTLANLEAVMRAVERLVGVAADWTNSSAGHPDYSQGRQLLDQHAELLLGPERSTRRVRILVTMPSAAAQDPALVRSLLAAGMDCVRINCAHDGPEQWQRMLEHLRAAEAGSPRRTRVLMDLAGPKLRTGPLPPGPAVLKVRPKRDPLGRVVQPARLWLYPAGAPASAPEPADGQLPIHAKGFETLTAGQALLCHDAREVPRRLEIEALGEGGAWARLSQTAYFTPEQSLHLANGTLFGHIGDLPRRAGELRLQRGERLVLTRSLEPGHAAEYDSAGQLLRPARIGCTLPEAFSQVHAGQSIWLDDGRIGGRVRSANRDEIEVEILQASANGSALRADKGINLPDTALTLPALTAKDQTDLEFVAQHADAVALSFVHDPADVLALEERLRSLGREDLGIVLKIETKRAFQRLPELLLAVMQSPRVGVMIARGDLAVECGFERLAEIQEEMLWICEAAHVPVIWATQVLETLAKTGRHSRAEITDAAMGERAECVMLNKGPHIASAVQALDNIFTRMVGHQRKKSPRLRALNLAQLPGLLG
jgi:pyruvate kinase